jgi:hypothetical protein
LKLIELLLAEATASSPRQGPGQDHQDDEHGSKDDEPYGVDLPGKFFTGTLVVLLVPNTLLPFLFMMLMVLFVVVHVLPSPAARRTNRVRESSKWIEQA